uniref:MSF1-domain-containing protein n=1 Tax=Rhabditophanes sp. KR3021 TaxID=114890 RepID=A0AC35U4H6_9BILA
MNYISNKSPDYFHLLKRPRILPDFAGADAGLNAVWKCKTVYWTIKTNLMPRFVSNATAKIHYSNFIIEGSFPTFKATIPLVSICYVQANSEKKTLSIRGRWFKFEMKGIENVEETQNWIRLLVLRQRIPHCILGKKFDWIKDEEPIIEVNEHIPEILSKKKFKSKFKNEPITNNSTTDLISLYDNVSYEKGHKFLFKKKLLTCFPMLSKFVIFD